jgi:gliding motility-associated-like protein
MQEADSVNVMVNPVPNIFIGNDTVICEGDTVILDPGSGYNEYFWMDGSTNQSIPAFASGSYWVKVINSFGCMDTDTLILITNTQPVLSVFPDDPAICPDSSVLLSVSGANKYYWSPTNTLSSDTGINVIAFPSVSTTYLVVGTDQNGCTGGIEVFVKILDKPVISVSPLDPGICEGETITLNADGGVSYKWYPAIGLSMITGDQVEAQPPYSIRYTVTGINEEGCPDTASTYLSLYPVPLVDLGSDFYLCDYLPKTLRVDPEIETNSYYWQDGSNYPYYCVSHPGIIWVKVSNEGCESTDTVNVMECTELWIPNAFSPDNDGLNDVFKPKSSTGLIDYNLQIYTRWGALIFESFNIENGWDGTYNGKMCDVGVYTYKLKYKGFGNTFSQQGLTKFGFLVLTR